MRALLATLLALAVAPVAVAAPGTSGDQEGAPRILEAPGSPAREPRLTEQRATRLLLADPKVADWLERYPPDPTTDAEFDRGERTWTVRVWSGEAGQVAQGEVDDGTGAVLEAWTGPQVAWKMARGYEGAFGGKTINSPLVWLTFAAIFLLGLADLRRPLSLRNLDLLVLLSFSVSLWFFNRGAIFWSVPLAYPPLAYLIARLAWVGVRGRAREASRPVWPVWVLAAATVFLMGFRAGLNVRDSNVIDVGYSGVVGAHRISNGQAPYGHMPVADERKPCGPADADGEVRDRIQTNGRCESANERGDTYGPVAYVAYLPAYWAFGWGGKWDDLPAAHATALLFDLLCLLLLALVGLRFGGARLAATLAFAWAAYPFTQYVSSSNTNDALLPTFLLAGFWLVSSASARGVASALSAWTKLASLVVAPLWLTYPDRRPKLGYAAAFALATSAAFSVLLLEPSLTEAVRTFFDRSLGWQVGRDSPFSLWGWGQYRAEGIPDLEPVQRVLQAVVVVAAIAAAFVPRRKSPLQLAALTAALIAAVQLVLTHWFYLYIPWFFPFAALALVAGSPRAEPAPESSGPLDTARELAAVR